MGYGLLTCTRYPELSTQILKFRKGVPLFSWVPSAVFLIAGDWYRRMYGKQR